MGLQCRLKTAKERTPKDLAVMFRRLLDVPRGTQFGRRTYSANVIDPRLPLILRAVRLMNCINSVITLRFKAVSWEVLEECLGLLGWQLLTEEAHNGCLCVSLSFQSERPLSWTAWTAWTA